MGLQKEEHKVYINASDPQVIVIDGKKYRLKEVTFKKLNGVEHLNKYLYKQIRDEKARNEKVSEIIEAISKKVSSKDFLIDFFNQLDEKDVEKVHNLIKKKLPIRKHKGCLGVQIGGKKENCYFQLRD
jgi:hypothetical protein